MLPGMNAIPPRLTCALEAGLAGSLAEIPLGAELVLTRDGQPVARVMRAGTTGSDPASALERLAELGRSLSRRGVTFTDADIRQLRDDGRR